MMEDQRNHSINISFDTSGIDTIFFDFHSSKPGIFEPRSKLQSKVKKLKESKHEYSSEKIGSVIKSTSIVRQAILAKSELFFSSSNCYKIKDLDAFVNSTYSIYYCRIEGQSKVEDDFRPKAQIEEVVFYSEKDAQTLWTYIKHLRNIEYFWESLDRSSCDMFIEKNRVYFVRM